MIADRVFRNALIVSVICHMFLFYNWPPLRNLPIFKTYEKLEVTYYPVRKAPPLSDLIDKRQRVGKSFLPATTRESLANLKREDLAKPAPRLKITLEKPRLKTLEIEKDDLIRHIPSDEKMLISHKEKDFSDEPTYLNYYNAVRSKIYKAANANKPYYFMEGEVRLSFTVARDGRLVKSAILKEGSTQNLILRNHASMSIKKASPFPPFHESMKEVHLTLRLTISFEK